jgi:hypothetical protein
MRQLPCSWPRDQQCQILKGACKRPKQCLTLALVSPPAPAVVLPSCILLPTLESCVAIPPLPGISPVVPDVAVRCRFMVLCVGVWGRPPSILLAAMLLLPLIMDAVTPAREAVAASMLPARPSAASERVGLQ